VSHKIASKEHLHAERTDGPGCLRVTAPEDEAMPVCGAQALGDRGHRQSRAIPFFIIQGSLALRFVGLRCKVNKAVHLSPWTMGFHHDSRTRLPDGVRPCGVRRDPRRRSAREPGNGYEISLLDVSWGIRLPFFTIKIAGSISFRHPFECSLEVTAGSLSEP
jgi:hypothetical protein